MMNYDDELDRALFALPLEPLPEDLRSSILAGIEALRAPLFSRLEIAGIGVILGLATWLCLIVSLGSDAFRVALSTIGATIIHFSAPGLLLWLAIGASTAVWLSIVSFHKGHVHDEVIAG
jgi:hypothetical protein